jgi:hypothetical protein
MDRQAIVRCTRAQSSCSSSISLRSLAALAACCAAVHQPDRRERFPTAAAIFLIAAYFTRVWPVLSHQNGTAVAPVQHRIAVKGDKWLQLLLHDGL